ncbi:YgaP-like transmembrane domain [Urbifossiella limnaea]|uniref:Inner membrane protein YgaP-like transmembrane domain-containing protein n=1 Tax=Urbifossiella limnaea TaxID=2528023 RepID=A0A517XY48_9BACT|nr:YgaP-like transmembrane domain [Urbifossiella limnaea]QDU22429.1 hypothetical protein ETAA1_44090 [Urbifossiella limnaea]
MAEGTIGTVNYPMTRQGVRDLDHPVRPSTGGGVNVGPAERAASALGGALLAGLGIGKGGATGLAMAAVGAALAYRGYSGHCSAYSALGVDTNHG